MGKKPLTVVAFELAADRLKFVEMTRADRRVIAAGVFPLSPGRGDDRAHLEAHLRSALDVAARGNLRGLIASVPVGEAALRVIDLPDGAESSAGEDAREHAAWDMGVYHGRPPAEFALDVQPGPDTATMTVAAFPRAAVNALRDTLESATGLELAALDVDAAALVNVCAASYPEHAAGRTLLIQANTAVTALVRAREGLFHGAVVRRDAGESLRADAAPHERAEGLSRLARGIAESLRAATGGWNAPDHVLLCGDLAVEADFLDLLRGHLSHLSTPVTVLNPFRNIPGPDPLDFPDVYPGAPLAAAVGLALRLAEDAR